jgi:hypothetical protein
VDVHPPEASGRPHDLDGDPGGPMIFPVLVLSSSMQKNKSDVFFQGSRNVSYSGLNTRDIIVLYQVTAAWS